MRYGLVLPSTCPGDHPWPIVELACLAEEAGWDSVFIEDYIVHWRAKDAPTYGSGGKGNDAVQKEHHQCSVSAAFSMAPRLLREAFCASVIPVTPLIFMRS